MNKFPSIFIYFLILLNLSHINSIKFKYNYKFLFSSLQRLRPTSRSKFVLFTEIEDPSSKAPSFKYETAKYPPYPYFDAPQNLFFDISVLNDNDDKQSSPSKESDIQREYLENAKLKRKGNLVPLSEQSPITGIHFQSYDLELSRSIGTDFFDYVYSEESPKKEEIKTDLAEYDAINYRFSPWPSTEDLKSKKAELNTSMYFELDKNNYLHKTLVHKPLIRNEIKTIAEAREEQSRWLERSKSDDWPLTYKEFSSLPLDMREAYYRNRYPVSDPDEQFLMVLNYRRALENISEKKNPLEFDVMENSYTFTPKESPILDDLRNWDDPLDCGWRLRANEAICDCVSYGWPPQDLRFHTGMDVYDITWLPGMVKVFVVRTRNECGNITRKELKLMLMKLGILMTNISKSEKRIAQLDKEEHTQVLENHLLVLCTHPEESKTLHSRREWNENKEKKVTITMNDDSRTKYEGILLGSDNVFGIDINVKGKKLTLPIPFVYEVCKLSSKPF